MAVRQRQTAKHKRPASGGSGRQSRVPAQARPAWLTRFGVSRTTAIELVLILVLGCASYTVVALLPALSVSTIPGAISWRELLNRIFGAGTIILAVAGVVLSVMALLRLHARGPALSMKKWVGGVMLFITLLSVADLMGHSGGTLGHWLRMLPVPIIGGAGAFVLFAVLVVVGIVFTFDVSRVQLQEGGRHTWNALSVVTYRMTRLARGLVTRLAQLTRVATLKTTSQPIVAEMPAPVQQRKPAVKLPKQATQAASAVVIAPPRAPTQGNWNLPSVDWLEAGEVVEPDLVEIKHRCSVIKETLANFNIPAKVDLDDVRSGPTITQFGIRPSAGVKVSRITGLRDDLALALEAPTIRMEAPVPGRPYVGVEVPNGQGQRVTMRELLTCEQYQKLRGKLRIGLGRDVAGLPVIADLARMPHLLIAGATGSGKSVCLNSIIASLLYENSPDELQLIMVDPKRVELTGYNGIPHLRVPVIVEMDKVVGALQWTIDEMERRYDLFAGGGYRNLERYNQSIREKHAELTIEHDVNFEQYNKKAAQQHIQPLPYIVVIIDELADLMMTAPQQCEQMLCRLAQKARATGIHLVVATQRPSVDVVTGLIKANFPTRIAFAVSSLVDSRTILDQPGAEKLLGRGDMLYTPADVLKPVRVQGTWVSDQELERVVDFWKEQRTKREDWRSESDERNLLATFELQEESAEDHEERLIEEASQVLQQYEKASASLLQRRLRISYNKAALLMDELEERGVVGTPEGASRSRAVLVRSPEAAMVETEV